MKDTVYSIVLFIVGIPAALMVAMFATALREINGDDDE